MNLFRNLHRRTINKIFTIAVLLLIVLFLLPFLTTKRVKRNTCYTEITDVALYIKQYHELPPNYITKYGLQFLINHDMDSENYVMGGDTHINVGQFSDFGIRNGNALKECDIPDDSYSIGSRRGEKRFVYTCNTKNPRVFYTEDHYLTYRELTSFQLQLTRNIFWILFGVYAALFTAFCILVKLSERQKTACAPEK